MASSSSTNATSEACDFPYLYVSGGACNPMYVQVRKQLALSSAVPKTRWAVRVTAPQRATTALSPPARPTAGAGAWARGCIGVSLGLACQWLVQARGLAAA